MLSRDAVASLPIFDGLTGEQLSVGLAAFRSFEVGAGEVLMEEGESDRSMMIVLDGELMVTLGDVEIGRVGAGETVGELVLFGTFDRRSATVTTLVGPTRLVVIDTEGLRFLRIQDNPVARALEAITLQEVARRLREMDYRIARTAAGQPEALPPPKSLLGRLAAAVGLGVDRPQGRPPSPLDVLNATPGFIGRDEQALANIAARLEVVSVARGDVFIEEGSAGDDAYVVAAGHVAVSCRTETGRSERVATLGAGSLLGHVSPIDSRVRSATCRALEPLYLLRIPGGVYRQLLSEQTAEGRAFRRGLLDGLAAQLRLANEHYVALVLRGRAGGIE